MTKRRLENHGVKVAILDLQQIGERDAGDDPGRWYYSIAYRLLRQLRIRVDLQSWWQDRAILSSRQRLVEFYNEILLQNVQERIVVFVDEIQCIEDLPSADQLLASIRAAHNARGTDPEFSRLTFVLLGECDPLSLIAEPTMSPFNVTQPINLSDFSRSDLDLFATELQLAPAQAEQALDRIHYLTGGQPYLTQKLARAVSRESFIGDVAENVDRIAMHQLAGRAALHNEPHMSHIHRAIVSDRKRREALLTLYGRIRKGIEVVTDLGSPLQRKLIAIGLITIDKEGKLAIRNRLYEEVFTTRWANRNLPAHWRTPAIAAALILGMLAVPFWYTQLLPRGYVEVLTSAVIEPAEAEEAYLNYRSFPGHVTAADKLFRGFVVDRAEAATDAGEIEALAKIAARLPDAGRLPDELRASYWDRQVAAEMRAENRDAALLASIRTLVLSTPARRSRAASLVGDDYPMLLASLESRGEGSRVFDRVNMMVTDVRTAQVSQWSLEPQGLQRRPDWSMTALEVSPLVRRVIVDRPGTVNRASLTLNLSHARVGDLRIKIITPSGRAVEVDPGVQRASSIQDLRIPARQLRELIGEPLAGTWSLSLRDEELGVAGRLVGWNLSLNSQGLIEDFQRGLNISDPAERETDNVWYSEDGRYAVARAVQSDSARIWDLAFATPVRAIAVNENEQLIGLGRGARMLVTATQDVVHVWDTATGDRVAALPIPAAGATATLAGDGMQLLVQRRGDEETVIELWSLEQGEVLAELAVAGTPAMIAMDSSGRRLAVADYDRAVRIWDFRGGELIAQVDLPAQPSAISLAAGGDVLGVVYGTVGAGLWSVEQPQQAIFQEFQAGRWQLVFSGSGSRALAGRAGEGYRIYDTTTGRILSPTIGSGGAPGGTELVAFSEDEQTVITAGPAGAARFWRAPAPVAQNEIGGQSGNHAIWPLSGDGVAIATPDASALVIGDAAGDVHFLPSGLVAEALIAESDSVSYFGHNGAVTMLVGAADGSKVASAAADNTIRIWDTRTQLPLPQVHRLDGEPLQRLAFSADGARLGILHGSTVQIVDVESGDVLARFDLSERHQGLAFADVDNLYVGADSGTLRVLSRQPAGEWRVRSIWQGDSRIKWLEASPRGRFLVLVEHNNFARQFSLAEGRIGESTLQLPSDVEEVSFSPGGSRVLFRTTGWVHRASSSAAGLLWLDALPAGKSIEGARMVFGGRDAANRNQSGDRLYLPTAGDGFPVLDELRFDASHRAGLFGNRAALLAEWQRKLGLTIVAPKGADQ